MASIRSCTSSPDAAAALAAEGELAPDIVVVGGGMAGVMAALAAKDGGNRVLIVEPSNVLGGQGTAGGVAGFCGDTLNVNRDFQDLVNRLAAHGFIRKFNPTDDRRSYDLEWCAFFLQEMLHERDVDVLLHTRAIGAETADGLITSLDLATAGGCCRVRPKFVIDASGACVVPLLAGFPVAHEGANRQLPMSLYFTLWDTGAPVRPFLPPSFAVWQRDEDIPMTTLHCFDSGKVEVKMKVVGFDAADGLSLSRAEMYARRQMVSLIYYLQTRGFRGMKFDRHALASVSRQIGVRETRRIVGEHCLTEEEVTHGAVFDDAVAVGTFHLDYHWPDKAQRADTGITTMVEPYHIPLRVMIPKGARNLLVPGRSASGEQMAMSSFRAMAPVSQMGFAAGKAAQLCAANGYGIDRLDLRQLQETIEAGGQRLDLSAYGIYLRNSLLDQEYVFGDECPFEDAHSPAIIHLRNNRFLSAWVGRRANEEAGDGLWVSDRFQCRWSKPRLVAKVGHGRHWAPILRSAPGGRVMLHFQVGPEVGDCVTWAIASADGGRSWTEAAPVAGSIPEQVNLVRLDEGVLVRADRLDPESPGAPTGLRLSLSSDHGDTWAHSLDLTGDGAGLSDPALISTPRGVAAVYGSERRRVAFWHGSIEQVMDPQALSRHTEALHCGIMP